MTSSLNSKSIFTVIRGLPKCLKRIQTFAYLLRSSLRGLFSLRIQLFMFLEIYDISPPPGHCWLPFDLLSLRAGPTHLDQWELSNTSGWPCWFTSLQMSVESHDGQNLMFLALAPLSLTQSLGTWKPRGFPQWIIIRSVLGSGWIRNFMSFPLFSWLIIHFIHLYIRNLLWFSYRLKEITLTLPSYWC